MAAERKLLLDNEHRRIFFEWVYSQLKTLNHYIPIRYLRILVQCEAILDEAFYVFVLQLRHCIRVYEIDQDLLMISLKNEK